MELFVPFVFLVVVVIVIVQFSMATSKRTDTAWNTAARTLGLSFGPAGFGKRRQIEGEIDGFRINVATRSRGSGKNRKTFTEFRLGFPIPLGVGLRLTREGLFSGFTKLFGAQDIETGDAAFDADVLVKGTDPHRVRELLTPGRRARVRRFLMSHSGALITDEGVRWSRRGVTRDVVTLVGTVRQLLALATSLTGEQKRDRRVERAIAAQHAGRIDEALTLLEVVPDASPTAPSRPPSKSRKAPEPPPQMAGKTRPGKTRPGKTRPGKTRPGKTRPGGTRSEESAPVESVAADEIDADEIDAVPVEEKVLEGELLYLADRPDEARRAFEVAGEAAPDDPEIAGWIAEAARKEASDPGPAPAPETATPDDVDRDELREALFGEDTSSFDAARIFDERYRGKVVRWTGTLSALERFSFDFVLGSEPGTRATIDIGATAANVYSDDRVRAIVKLHPDDADRLQDAVGKDVTFQGTLLKADSFMKNVFVGDGRVEVA